MPRLFRMILVPCLALGASSLGAAEPDTTILKQLRAVGAQARGSAEARAAWDRLAQQGPEVLPAILEAMNTPDTVASNWLRSAFDRIADRAMDEKNSKAIPVDALLAFARDPKKQGRARRLALGLIESLRPGTRVSLLADWIDDPEFRFDAIEQQITRIDADKDLSREKKEQMLRAAFAASRDLQQGRAIATRLRALDVSLSVADHMGFLRSWYAIGPFDAHGMKGFTSVYPHETKVDLEATLTGKDGKELRWKPFLVEEALAGKHAALVNLRLALGDAEDAVGYAYTTIKVPEVTEVELRGAGDDNMTLWVNNKRVFGFEEYRNGVRLDRHRVRVKLEAGVNTILVKIVQAPTDTTNPAPNWEFLLRICDSEGKGLLYPSALPAARKPSE